MQTVQTYRPTHKEVKKRLIDLDMSQAQLAKQLNISAPYLVDILKGNRDGTAYFPRIIKILRLDSSVQAQGEVLTS